MEQEEEVEIEEFLKQSIQRVVPQFKRVHRAIETAAKSEIKIYLRENNIDESLLTDEEYEFIVSAIEHKVPIRELEEFAKRYLYRQLRRVHNPSKTAKYLKYSFRDTLIYFVCFLFYMALVYTVCHRMPWPMCVVVRLMMTMHLGYYNFIWLKRISCALFHQVKDMTWVIWQIARYLPAVFFETTKVLFEVFIGWPLFSSIIGVLFVIYIIPIAFPEMGLSSIFVDLYSLYVSKDIPFIQKMLSFFV